MQGALEADRDLAEAATAALDAAREAAPELGITREEAATAAAEGIMAAAHAAGDETVEAVREALPDGLARQDPPEGHGEEGEEGDYDR